MAIKKQIQFFKILKEKWQVGNVIVTYNTGNIHL